MAGNTLTTSKCRARSILELDRCLVGNSYLTQMLFELINDPQDYLHQIQCGYHPRMTIPPYCFWLQNPQYGVVLIGEQQATNMAEMVWRSCASDSGNREHHHGWIQGGTRTWVHPLSNCTVVGLIGECAKSQRRSSWHVPVIGSSSQLPVTASTLWGAIV